MSKREVIQAYNNQNRFKVLWDNENFPELSQGMGRNSNKKQVVNNLSNKDTVVNRILTPLPYNLVAKKPRKPYIHQLGAKMNDRMFEEPSPSAPVYMKDEHRVSELERVTRELLKFMQDFFTINHNQMALDAVNHFEARINKVSNSNQNNTNVTNHGLNNDNKNTTI